MKEITPYLTLIATAGCVWAYLFGCWLYKVSRQKVWLHPVLVGSSLLAAALFLSPLDYPTFWQKSEWLRFGLGLVTVALAIPLYRELNQLKGLFLPALITIVVGSVLAPALSIICALLIGLTSDVAHTFITKSITTPVALVLAEHFGTVIMLATAITVFTGVIGALIAPSIFRLVGLTDTRLQGIVLGVNAHGVGTIKAFEISRASGAIAGLSMGITGCVSVFLLPLLLSLFTR